MAQRGGGTDEISPFYNFSWKVVVGIPYAMNVRTVPLIPFLQIGQFLNAGAHLTQETKCPQGNNTIETSSSMQILQSLCSLSLKFSSSRDFASAPFELVSFEQQGSRVIGTSGEKGGFSSSSI